MKERIKERSRAGLFVSLGLAATLLTGDTMNSASSVTEAPNDTAAASTKANRARDAIAALYGSCKIIDIGADPQSKHPHYNAKMGYDPQKLIVDLRLNPEAVHYRTEYKDDDAVTWGDQSVRLRFYSRVSGGDFEETQPITFRPEQLPTQSGRTNIGVYPSERSPEGMVIVPHVGNTAVTQDGEVSAATPCGAIEKTSEGWEVLENGPEVVPIRPEPTNHSPVMAF